jgi:formylglycine-generating enzyme required for sulfatase activity
VNAKVGGKFSVAYAELHRYVRRPGIESDIRLLSPMEYHASTTELVQLLEKDHHGVRLDDEAWDRLNTWIDLNAPYHGTWTEIVGEDKVGHVAERAREMRRRFTGRDEDFEAIPPAVRMAANMSTDRSVLGATAGSSSSGTRQTGSDVPRAGAGADWPLDAAEAQRRQRQLDSWNDSVDLGEGVTLDLVRVPAGRCVMGSTDGYRDEQPATLVHMERPFWIGRCEVTNEQYARFDAEHDSRVEPMHGYQFGIRGYPANLPRQPVVRVSWERAQAFCSWLSRRTGRTFRLPSEAQWEYACRAGRDQPMWYGDADTDFTRCANLGDARLREFALDTYIQVRLVENPNRYDDWVPKDDRFDDGGFLSMPVGSYDPNPWGLSDMHGNVWEWTRSAYRPYPYHEADGRNDPTASGRRVVRGGSWYDRPHRCRAAMRLAFEPYQGVFNVGFRVVSE